MKYSKHLFSFILIFFFAMNSFGQNKDGNIKKSEPFFINVEIMPFWKSCALDSISMAEQKKCSDECFLEFIYSNLKYPRGLCYSGKVIVQITIKKTGEVSNLKFIREYPEPIKREVKKIFDQMPDWMPGTQRGIPVDVIYTIPISFDLS